MARRVLNAGFLEVRRCHEDRCAPRPESSDSWCDRRDDIAELADIEPMHVAAYIRGLGKEFEKPTVKQHLAAIRMLFDWLVTGQVVATNPAHAVRGPKHVVKTGKTTVLTGEQARELLDSIDVSTLVGLRDRALIAVMTFAFARIGAVIAMRVEDYFPKGKRWWVRLHEKGGKRHEMPAHHNGCSARRRACSRRGRSITSSTRPSAAMWRAASSRSC